MADQDPASLGTAYQQADQIETPKMDFVTRLGNVLSQGDKNSAIEKALNNHNQRRIDEAKMHHQNATTAGSILAFGYDPSKLDPVTNKPIPLTDEQRQMYQTQYDSAMDAYQKIVGVDKNTKTALERARGIVDHLIKRGAQTSQSGVSAPSNGSGLPPPPAPPGTAGAAVTPQSLGASQVDNLPLTKEAALAPPPAPPSSNPLSPSGPSDNIGVPSPEQARVIGASHPDIPPAHNPLSYEQFSAQAPFLRQQLAARLEDARAMNKFRSEETFKHALKMQDVQDKPDKYDLKVLRQADGSEKLVAVNKSNPEEPYIDVKSSSGDIAQPGGRKVAAGEGKLEVVGGVPTGRVMHDGKFVAPGDKSYTPEDAAAVTTGLGAQNFSQKQKEALARIRGAAYANAAAHFKFTNVVDKDSGETGEVSALDMAKNPGKYAGASEQEKIAARDAVHQSLNVNFDAVDKSLDALPNGLDSKTQAIIKAALKGDDTGTIQQLLINRIKTMDPNHPTREEQAQIEYLTNLKALQEDVMTLRAVSGITGSSDTLRNAIVALVPGSSTASAMEAKLQLKAARRTSEALFGGRPQGKIGPGRKGGLSVAPAPSGASTTTKKGDPLGIL